MSKKYGLAGFSTRELADKRRRSGCGIEILGVGIAVFILFLLLNQTSFNISDWWYIGLFFLAVFILRLVDDHSYRQMKTVHRAERGAKAEEQVDNLLDRLDNSYVVLNDIESPNGNIDHLIISQQNGIYLLETKSHWGKITLQDNKILLNGQATEKDFVNQALSNSYWVKEQVKNVTGLSPWITPIVVFTNAFVEYGPPIKGVRVMNQRFLLNFLCKPVQRSSNNLKIWGNREQIIARLNNKEMDRQEEPDGPLTSSNNMCCPNCGAPLERRKAVRGEHIGEDYLVCTKFPTCKTFFLADTFSSTHQEISKF